MSKIPEYLDRGNHLLDNNPLLIQKVSISCNVDDKSAKSYLIECLKFLHLIGVKKQKLTPSLKVDLAWHEFILFTRTYHQFCSTEFGRYIHHQPGGDEKQNRHQFKNTLMLYALTFGTPPIDIWEYSEEDDFNLDCGAEL